MTKLNPHFIDTKRGYSRVYGFKKVKPRFCGDPNWQQYDTGKRKPIDEMNGYVAFPLEQAQDMYKVYIESLNKKCSTEP